MPKNGAAYYGQHYSAEFLRKHCFISRQGVSLLGISEAAEQLGMHTIGVQLPLERLVKDVSLPCIIHWNQNHFVVLYQVRKSRKGKTTFYVADPAGSLLTYTEEEFKRCWLSNRKAGTDEGIALCLEPTPAFYQKQDELEECGIKKVLNLYSFGIVSYH